VITISAVCRSIPDLTEAELRRFIDAEWVRPVRRASEPVFSELDLARIRLILDLRATLEVEEQTVPLVLSLLDQLYATRRQLRRVLAEMDEDTRARLLALLTAEA
jgi:chaperone modulatory protein CbpM